MAKFNVKAALVFNKAQSVEGTPVTPLGTDVVPLADFSYEDVFVTEEVVYIGNELGRDSETVSKDRYAKYSGTAFMPVRGSSVALATIADFKMAPLFQACGANCALTGTLVSDQVITVTNSIPTTTLLTGQIRFSTADIATQKTFQVYDSRGTVDLSMEIFNKSKLKFNMMGNYTQATQETAITVNYGTQKSLAAQVLLPTNIICSELTGLIGGFTHTGISGTVKNLCFSKLDAPNLFGFTLERFGTSCQIGFTKDADPSDVTLTILEDAAIPLGSESATAYDPDNHINDFHKFSLKYGTAQGKWVSIYFDNLQLVSTSQTTISKFRGRDLKFRNIGNVTLTFA